MSNPRRDRIVAQLHERGQATAGFFRALEHNQRTQQVYSTGDQWQAQHLLAHFVIAEREFTRFGYEILAGGEGAPEGFDIDGFNATSVPALMAELPAFEALLAAFEDARARTIVMVETCSDADLDREGRHPFFGWLPLEKLFKFIYRHNMIHERDIKRALSTGEPVPHVDIAPPAG